MEKELKRTKKVAGITLIALVITIVVLIILAGVLINISLGNNGLFNKAKTAKEMYTNAQAQEELDIAKMTNQIDGYVGYSRTGEISDELVNAIAEKLIKQGISNPVGTIIAYSVNNVPTGYLKCEGQAVSRTTYSELFAIIGTTYGEGDGSTSFNVPDLRGEFLRGTGTNSHKNTRLNILEGAGLEVGKHQEATTHPSVYANRDGNFGVATGTNATFSNVVNPDRIGTGHGVFITSAGYHAQGSDWQAEYTSRPTNTSVLYCIKY